MRIFVSSTCHDLIDIRAELATQLRELGIVPLLSDDKLSDFKVQTDTNSIKVCLANVESCNEVILILDRRYGPRLGKIGFDDFSATHLEYRHAVANKIPVSVFVRDKTVADYSTWTDNSDHADLKLRWVNDRNFGLFELLDEHKKLTADDRPNWYHTFTNSTDLRAAVRKRYSPRLLPKQLAEAINDQRFPVMTVDVSTEQLEGHTLAGPGKFVVKAFVRNAGGGAAFDCSFNWEESQLSHSAGEQMAKSTVMPGDGTRMQFVSAPQEFGERVTAHLLVSYQSSLGVEVHDRFRISYQAEGTVLKQGGTLMDRRYIRSTGARLTIEDPGV
jgi:hypothetical protein